MPARTVSPHSADPAAAARMVPIGPEHELELARLFERNGDPLTQRLFDPFPLTAETARAIARGPRRDLYFGAELDGELLAMTMLRGWDAGHEVPSFGVLVDHERRGRGLGRRVTELTIERPGAAGCRQVRLSVYESNSVARALYERLGFSEAERAPKSTAAGPDVRIVMTLDLDTGP